VSLRSRMTLRTRVLIGGGAALLVAVIAIVPLAAGWWDSDTRPVAAPKAAPSEAESGSAETSTPSPTPSAAPSASASAPAARTGTGSTLHFIANLDGQGGAAARLGYNLIDTGPTKETVDALPAGQRALVWLGSLGNKDCASPSYSFAEFTAAVDRLTGDPKVFGYFIADEPHPKVCPNIVADIRQRADYIKAHDPSHKSFIVVLDGTNQCGGTYGCEFKAFAPASSHVDLIGLDPYPCNVDNASSGCTYNHIDDTVRRAEANGVPRSAMVPVFPAFGQACGSGSNYYRLPGVAEMRAMLAHWATLVPRPAFDYTYTWGHQGSACPTLVDADGQHGYPDLQSVMRTHNQG
jgi:hypothetical protein